MKINCTKVALEIENNDLSSFYEDKISEKDLLTIATKLKKNELENIKILFDHIIENNVNENCDWNIGSTIQHFNIQNIMNYICSLPKDKKSYLYDSIGISWAIGDSESKDERVIEFLYDILDYSTNPDSWWRAAYSLENLIGKNAINLLKRSLKHDKTYNLDNCLSDLSNKRKVIGLLLNANSLEIKDKIYPELKKQFYESLEKNDKKLLLNIIWIFGRLRLYDNDIYKEIIKILNETDDYEIIYYIFQSFSADPKEIFHDLFIDCFKSEDPLVKKMAIRGISSLNYLADVDVLGNLIESETNEAVIGEITKALYNIKNDVLKQKKYLYGKYIVNENGLIIDDSDKWYADASIYNIFSENEDPENLSLTLIKNKLEKENIIVKNPIDLACGTGKVSKYILNHIDYSGTLYAVDSSKQMLDYLQRTIDRQKYYVDEIELINKKTEEFNLENNEKSTLIISSFGFPSKISSKERTIKELKKIYDNLDDNGVFVTIGWDETFNDELNEMWYKYIPDDIKATSFENWRKIRSSRITSPRNCNLTWYKKNLQLPLIFRNLEESVNVMGHLFGRDAATSILKSEKKIWWMAYGITWDTKESIKNALIKLGELE